MTCCKEDRTGLHGLVGVSLPDLFIFFSCKVPSFTFSDSPSSDSISKESRLGSPVSYIFLKGVVGSFAPLS